LSGRVTNVSSDAIIEIGSEMILVDSVSGSTITTKERGFLETNPAAHSAADRVLINPLYPRKTVFDKLCEVIGDLYGNGIYVRKVDDTQTYTSTNILTLPAGAKRLLRILVKDPNLNRWSRLRRGWDVYDLPEFTPPAYQIVMGGGIGNTLKVVYATDFTPPTAETDDLGTVCGISDTLQPHLPMAMAGYLLQGKELPRVQMMEVRRLLATQGVQVGQALNVGQALITSFVQRFVQGERIRIEEQDPPDFEWAVR